MYFEWILSQIVSTIKQRLIWLQLFRLLWTSTLMSSLWCHFYPGEQSSPYESPIWVCPLKSSIQTYRQAWMAHKPQVCSLSLISLWFHWYWYWLYWYWLCWYWHWLYWAHCCFTSPKKNFIHIKGCLPLDWTDAQSLGRTHLKIFFESDLLKNALKIVFIFSFSAAMM